MMPSFYNNNYQIVQAPGYVTILVEMIHDMRIISLDGRPHIPANIRQWLGDSRGRWEGNTLVVDTTNFTDKTNYRGSGDYGINFVRAGFRQWGGTMQDDVTDATRWAIAQGRLLAHRGDRQWARRSRGGAR